ncbi:FAD-dependent thymidylate synthase [Metabacillus arenae]|uniref:FAD-dependent thymidylate synthase n=1 Tax=Metabacillus arenae TaxID=2771434 RepID=A0A926NCK4_9BACI|nr:FAD-dependent thymidylate synthase [Metabacillus arenae]MBD1379059.1 FAD-dependent thymidylate synthase [Metabacillus arenae]
MITMNEQGNLVYHGDTFQIVLQRYSDPERLNAARNAAIYLGKKDRGNVRRPLSIIRQGHVPEVFRGEFAEFEFVDVSKEVYDHIITYTTRNMRVAGGNRALTSDDFAMPDDKMKNPDLVHEMIQQSLDNYQKLLEIGETPQVSRSAMPVNAKINPFVYQFNFVTLMQSLFKQRIWEKGAQGNTVKVVQGMWELVNQVDPDLWQTAYEWFGQPATDWTEVRRKIKKKCVDVTTILEMLEEDLMSVGENIDSGTPFEDWLVSKFGEQKSMW